MTPAQYRYVYKHRTGATDPVHVHLKSGGVLTCQLTAADETTEMVCLICEKNHVFIEVSDIHCVEIPRNDGEPKH